jgi:signal transduction histidine kinase
VIALVLAGLLIANGYVFTQLEMAGVPAPGPLSYVSGLVMCAALVARHVYPLAVLVVVAIAFTVYGFTGGLDVFGSNIALFLATVTAGSHGRERARDWVRGLVIAGLFGTLFYLFFAPGQGDLPLYARLVGQVYGVALNVFYFAAAWVFGDQVRTRRQRERDLARRTAELSARTVELEAARARSEQEAAVAERLRIARELHDVLGHHVSVMGVQAGAARRVRDRDPARAADALEAIEGSSRESVTELQRVLKLLREPDDDGRGSLGALGRLDELADEVRRAGVAVTLQVGDLPPRLPTDLDLAAVRVVQESLTNTLRHAGPGSSAWVTVRVAQHGIEIETTDDGRGTPLVDDRAGSDGVTSGSGLRGMRERVELHGGTFVAGPVKPRGWRVAATIPHTVVTQPAS